MENPIDFTAKTDRELLVLVAQRTNDLVEDMTRLGNRLGCTERKVIRLDMIWKVALALAATSSAGGGLWKLLS